MRIVTAALMALALAGSAHAATYTMDSAHTYPQFEIRHLAFSTLHGQFNHTTGTITMDRKAGLGSVQATIDVDSLDTGFAKRDEDLKSAAFFDVAKYPTMTYQSTKVIFHGKDRATVEGKLTLHGVTKPVTLHVTRIHCGINPIMKKEVCGFDAVGELKRSDFGIKTYLPVIPDQVRLIINTDAVKDE